MLKLFVCSACYLFCSYSFLFYPILRMLLTLFLFVDKYKTGETHHQETDQGQPGQAEVSPRDGQEGGGQLRLGERGRGLE